MGINEYTLKLIDNFVEATGQGQVCRSKLSPADYLLFRQQAIVEHGIESPFVTQQNTPENIPVIAPQQITQEPALQPVTTPINIGQTVKKATVNEHSVTESFYGEEDDEKDGMLALLKSIPG